jgi:hypothetical protein
MQPLSTDKETDLDEIICISAFGSVTLINNDPATFLIHATQYVAGGQSTDDIAIHADLSRNPKWANLSERLPQLKAVISVWGKLDCFDVYTYAGIKTTTCVIVNVEDIIYLFNPKCEPTEKPPSPHKKSNLQEKFKKCARARKTSPGSSPSTSQKQLDKCPAHSSEDEVNKRV